jgi:hypothetical protein
MMMLAKEISTVTEDPVLLIDSGAPKHPFVDSLSEPPSRRLRGSLAVLNARHVAVGLLDVNTTVHQYEYYRLTYRHPNNAVPQ